MCLKRAFPRIGAGLGLGIMALSVALSPTPMLLYNPSPSAPVGWYRIDRNADLERGLLVASYLPAEAGRLADRRGYLPPGAPVIKPLAGLAGDAYCITSGALILRDEQFDIQLADRSGAALPRLETGCRIVAEGHVLLLSNRLENSFDSRYFGEVTTDLVIGEAIYLGTDKDELAGEGGRARAQGAQGKIKGPGAAPELRHCLHIDFEGAAGNTAALCVSRFLKQIRGLAQRHFTGVHETSPASGAEHERE